MRLKYLCSSFSNSLAQSSVQSEGKYKVYGASGFIGYLDEYGVDAPYLGIVKDGAGVGRVQKHEPNTSLLGTLAYIIPNEKADIGWLNYVIQSLDLGKDVGKTTIPHIYFSEYGNREIHYVSLPQQKRIADYLDMECSRINAVIEQTRASIEEYKKLKQAIITQAVTKDSFSASSQEVPDGWVNRKLKTFITIPVVDGPHESPELVETGVPYISATAIENGKINFDLMRGYISEKYSLECDKRYKPQRNDILVVKLGASTGQVAIVESDDRFNIWVPLAAVRCNDQVNSRFIYYCFQSEYLVRQMELSWTFGTQQTLGVKTIEQLKFLIPPLKEQLSIVSYLDRKCSEIDALLEKKTKFLAEIEDYKKSLIFEYVTGKKEVV